MFAVGRSRAAPRAETDCLPVSLEWNSDWRVGAGLIINNVRLYGCGFLGSMTGAHQHRRARGQQTARRRDGAQLQLCIPMRRTARRTRRYANCPPRSRNAALARSARVEPQRTSEAVAMGAFRSSNARVGGPRSSIDLPMG